MKRSVFAVAAIALTATALSSVAQAQVASTSSAQPFKFGVSAGVSFPTGDISSTDLNAAVAGGAQTGFNVNGIIGYEPVNMPFGLRGELMYDRFAIDKNYAQGASANYSVLGGNVNAILNLGALGTASSVQPYLIGGIGYSQLKASNTSGGASVSNSGIAFNGGIGLKFPLGTMSTFLEARYHYVNTQDTNAGAPNATFIPVSFGILF
jgi:hypothetical protein